MNAGEISGAVQALGGEVRFVREQYGVNYTADLMSHPYLARLPLETRLLILDAHVRRCGTEVSIGGCAEWTPEQFLKMVARSNDLSDAFERCLREDNFLSRQLGVTDFEAAPKRLDAHRARRLARIRAKLAAEGIEV